MVAEECDRAGEIITEYSIKVSKYLQPTVTRGLALYDQPEPHIYFHRPLHVLLGEAFGAGFVLDGLEEPAFPNDYPHNQYSLTWGSNFSQIPPVLIARMRSQT
jgi:hypothetical protein